MKNSKELKLTKCFKVSKKTLTYIVPIVLSFSFLTYCCFSLVPDTNRLKNQIADTQNSLTSQQELNAHLSEEVSDISKNYIEEKGRELGYSYQGEVIIYDISQGD